MKKISSKLTYYYKVLFPLFWFALGGAILGVGLYYNQGNPIMFIIPAIILFGGYYAINRLLFDLVDAVYDNGTSLKVVNKGIEITLLLEEIVNVNYLFMMSPPRVTLKLRNKSKLGEEISFCAPVILVPLSKSKVIIDLIDRIDKARTQ